MVIKAYYPNGLKRDKFVTVKLSECPEAFQILPRNVAKLITEKIVHNISYDLTRPFSISERELSTDQQLRKINEMKEVLNFNYSNPSSRDIELSHHYEMLCKYRQDGKVTASLIKYHILTARLEYPVEQEKELLQFTKYMATKCTKEICRATELVIRQWTSFRPQTDKIQSSPATEKTLQSRKVKFSERVDARTYSIESPPSKQTSSTGGIL